MILFQQGGSRRNECKVCGRILEVELHHRRNGKAEQQQLQRQHAHGAPGQPIPHQAADRPKDSPGELALKHGDRQRQRQQPERLCRPELEQPGRGLQNSTKKAQQRIADPFDDLAPAAFPA